MFRESGALSRMIVGDFNTQLIDAGVVSRPNSWASSDMSATALLGIADMLSSCIDRTSVLPIPSVTPDVSPTL